MTNMFAALVRYARTRTDLPPPCYRFRTVDWVLDIRSDGMTVEPYGETDAVPYVRRSGVNPMPLLAVDTAAYVLGRHGDSVTPKRAEACASAFWTQLGQWLTGPNAHPAVGAALTLAQVHGRAESPHDVPEKATVAVRVEGMWLHRLPGAQVEWLRIVSDLKGGRSGLCVACGQVRMLAETLPSAIPASLLPGAEHDAQLTVLPLSERKKGTVLPICVECGDLAANVLQTLLNDHTRTATAKGQNSIAVAFGLGGPNADAEAVRIMQMIGAR